MRALTKEDKSELKCEVNICLYYTDCDDVRKRFASLCRCLHAVDLTTTIINGRRFGPCLNLKCNGDISLLDAEWVLDKQNEYVLPLEIRYDNGKFLLTNTVR